MAYIESHTVTIRHRKLVALAKDLRLKPVYVLGHLHALWHAALEQADDGDLSSWSDEFIAESACYEGNAPQFVSLLQKHIWLNGRVIHDWLDYAGKYLRECKYRRNPKKWEEILKKHNSLKTLYMTETLSVNASEPNQTNQTEPNQTEPNIPHQKRFIPPTLEEIKTYCQERGNSIDPQSFFDKGESNGWVDKNGNKYKDWKAVIRTWEKYSNFKPDVGKSKEERLKEAIAKVEKDKEAERAIMASK